MHNLTPHHYYQYFHLIAKVLKENIGKEKK